MASPVNSLLGSSASSGTNASTATAAANATADAAPSEQVFLQLLVSQIQNQDPLNPTDSTQFVSQLAQFSELEQVVAIRSDIETAMSSSAQQNATDPSSTPATGTSNNSTGTSTN
ncbi:MAG TPA: flagellar hook capping FlgD N-terminal domain-containing protein [Bryobacteraceae bacterium]|jgi:flagellar basal-body rod modification protein FlgD|nr:flagellar hook capping FlgD N-terminal domain-containing protein [Bryobacteraceae bacterium]